MSLFSRWGWGRTLLLAAAVVGGTVFTSGAFAQGAADTALVPFVVNVDATVMAIQDGSADSNAKTVTMQVTAGEEAVLHLPLGKSVSVVYGAPRRSNAPMITSGVGGRITLNLPAQSYKNAEVSLYAVNGRRVFNRKVSASEAMKDVSNRSVVAGVYILAVNGVDGNKFTSRFTHRGGGLNIAVAFGGENVVAPNNLSKKAADYVAWTIYVGADGYTDTMYTFSPVVGENPPQDITLREATTTLGTPTDIIAKAVSTTSITVSWFEVPGATTYRIYSSTSSNGTYTLVGSVPTTAYTHNDLSSGTTYYYRVSAFSSSGESTRSSPIFAKPAIFNAPSNVTAEPAAGGIKVSWSTVTGATGYYVYAGASDDIGYSLLETIKSSSATSYIHEGLELNTGYYYTVSAYNRDGEGIRSPGVTAKVVYGAFTDTRDNKKYKTTNIGSQTWMAENLNYQTLSGSWCYKNSTDSCAKYGRLYDWATAMGVEPLFNSNLWGGGDNNHQGVCPAGWHLPSRAEWGTLAVYAGGTGDYGDDGTAGKALRACGYWKGSTLCSVDNTDDDIFHFSGLHGGYRYSYSLNPYTETDYFEKIGYNGIWWTATETNNYTAYTRTMGYFYAQQIECTAGKCQQVNRNDLRNYLKESEDDTKSYGYSVRCIAN